MNNTAEATKLKKPLWRRIIKWGIRILLILVVLIVVIWSSWNYLSARSLRNEIDRIRAAGEPVTFRDLTASLEKVDETNDAAPFYAAALELLRKKYGDKALEVDKGFDKAIKDHTLPSPELLADAEQLLEENHIALELIDRGRDLLGCNYDLGLDYGISVVLSRLNPARTMAKMNSLRTRFLAFQGKGDEAGRSAISSLRMLRMFDRQPILISYLVKIACMSLVSSDIQVILEFGHPSPKAMQELENALLQVDQSINLKRVWIAERVYSLEVMRNLISAPRRLDADAQTRPLIPERWPSSFVSSPFMRSMVVDLLKVYAKLINASDNDWPDMLDAMKKSAAQGWGWSPFGVFSRILGPSLERATVLMGRCIATTRSALLGVMIERYRQLKGGLPERLDELESAFGQKLPADPFTGKSLIYRRSGDSYKIYSVGDDGKDDGGKLTGRGRADWGVQIHSQP